MVVIATLIYLFGVPLAVMLLERKWTWITKVSPMAVLYVVGLAVANMGFMPKSATGVCDMVSNLMVPLSLPLLLFGCNLKNWSTPLALKAFVCGMVSILVVLLGGFALFRSLGEGLTYEQFAQVTAVSAGIYTGGIPNIGAIAKGVGLSNELYLLVTSYDLVATGLYLVFVVVFGKVVFRWLLPTPHGLPEDIATKEEVTHDGLKTKLMLAGLALGVAALGYGVTRLVCGELNIALLILVITTLSLLLAQWKPVKEQHSSFDMGVYLVDVFCLSIASMVNVADLHLLDHLNILWYIMFVIFGSLVLQVVLAKVWKIDGDTVLTASVALINSPPFVPMVAGMLGNRQVVVTGVSIGLAGYAVGNFLGIGLYQLLLLIG